MIAAYSTPTEFMRPQALAKHYGITDGLLRKLIWQKTIPTYRIGRAVFIRRGDFEAYLDARRVPLRPNPTHSGESESL